MKEIDFFKIWDSAFRNAKKKSRKCLVNGCNKTAIKSHVLQKNGILKEISEKNHLFQFSNVSPFQKQEKENFKLSRIGINDVYTFPGFCNKHDTSIFQPIESNGFDISSKTSINLFSYRALCQEIRRKEIAVDIADKMIETNYNIALVVFMSDYKTGLLNGLKNLNFFKEELENDLERTESNFIHRICKIPKIEICISAPLNIYDEKNSLSETHDNSGKVLNNPFVTSILNIFPFENKSFVMITLHKDYKCNWTENLFVEFENVKSSQHLKLISDLISTRMEFWCMSPKLKNTIDKSKIKHLIKLCTEEVLNFDAVIKNEFNLFE